MTSGRHKDHQIYVKAGTRGAVGLVAECNLKVYRDGTERVGICNLLVLYVNMEGGRAKHRRVEEFEKGIHQCVMIFLGFFVDFYDCIDFL